MNQTPTHTTGLRDNHSRGSAGDFLRDQIQPGSELSFVSAYFTIHAYAALKEPLEAADHLRFLFGEPKSVTSLEKDGKDARHFVLGNQNQDLNLSNQLTQKQVARECAAWIRDKVEIRSVTRSGFLHGKLYHIRKNGLDQAILGSSNFTVPGLGLKESNNNVELNLIVDSRRDVDELRKWFDEVWDNKKITSDVRDKVLAELDRLHSENSPEFIYYLTLFHLFHRFLEDNAEADLQLERTNLFDSVVWKMLFRFQKDGVRGAIRRLRDFHGCILADSVGLGKTFEALAVIKYYQDRGASILVLCPKKLWSNWNCWLSQGSLNPLAKDKFNYHMLAHTDLSRTNGQVGPINLEDLPANYDLIVIDESHNFRNNAVGTETQDGKRRRTRYERLMEDIIQAGIRSRVLLLSATPVNNQLSDLRNQISFIAGGDVARRDVEENAKADRAFAKDLEIPSIFETTRKAQAEFTIWTGLPAEQRSVKDLLNRLGGDLFTLLDALSIARSRKQIERHYKDEMEELGGFPKREKPQSEYPEIDTLGKFPPFVDIDLIISGPVELRKTKNEGGLKLFLYHPSMFLRGDLPDETKSAYERKIGNFNQEGRERILIAMMKVNFLKRLESSIDSFRVTIDRTLKKIDKLEKRLTEFEEHRDAHGEIDYDLIEPDESDIDDGDFDTETFKIGGRHRIHLGHIDIPKWRQALSQDSSQLLLLYDRAKPVNADRDAKLQRLKTLLASRFKDPETNKAEEPIRKVIIFTAYADTARYLHDHITPWAASEYQLHSALVAGTETRASTGKNQFEHILSNFSPRSKSRPLGSGPEIDILIATDCISEGQNLQDANYLINYDIHWNPVRIIQRFGRIDRIGSLHHKVHLVNFWPTKDLNAYLKLKERVESRMALVDLTASSEDNLLNTEQVDDLIASNLNYRNKQLKKLQEEILDLEDMNEEGITLADFSLDDFRQDLLAYLNAHEKLLRESPSGLYAVVPTRADVPQCQPGVIFCLRQGDRDGVGGDKSKINPLRPHFLLYILDSGDVRLSFVQPKATLQLFRELAAGKSTAHARLCDQFEASTANGSDMSHYAGLIASALRAIQASFERRAAGQLLSGRDGLLPTKNEIPDADAGDWELVTWLVILDPKS